jgi:hypothetical protein
MSLILVFYVGIAIGIFLYLALTKDGREMLNDNDPWGLGDYFFAMFLALAYSGPVALLVLLLTTLYP